MFVPTFGRSLRSLVPAMKIFPDGKRIIRFSAAMLISVASTTLFAQVRIVETPNATLRLDESTCDLVGVHWKSPALDVINEPKLGENFRLLLPKPGYEAAYFNSRDQKVSGIESADDGVTCYYSSLRNAQEVVPLEV
jgi:hypothetical protein